MNGQKNITASHSWADGIRRRQREEALTEHGCNYFGKGVIRSAPFAPFLRQDLLQLALELKRAGSGDLWRDCQKTRRNPIYD